MLATSRHLVLSLSTHSSLFYNWVHMQGFDKSTDKLVVLVLVPVVERKGMEVGTALDIQVVQEEVVVEWVVEVGVVEVVVEVVVEEEVEVVEVVEVEGGEEVLVQDKGYIEVVVEEGVGKEMDKVELEAKGSIQILAVELQQVLAKQMDQHNTEVYMQEHIKHCT